MPVVQKSAWCQITMAPRLGKVAVGKVACSKPFVSAKFFRSCENISQQQKAQCPASFYVVTLSQNLCITWSFRRTGFSIPSYPEPTRATMALFLSLLFPSSFLKISLCFQFFFPIDAFCCPFLCHWIGVVLPDAWCVRLAATIFHPFAAGKLFDWPKIAGHSLCTDISSSMKREWENKQQERWGKRQQGPKKKNILLSCRIYWVLCVNVTVFVHEGQLVER